MFKCPKCRYISDSKDGVASHNDEEHCHFCDKCGSVFDSKMDLANHDVKDHSYKCEYCAKLFGSEEILDKHEKAEHKRCDVCEDEFTWVDKVHSCYYTKNNLGPDSERVVVQNMYFQGITHYYI